MSDEEDTKKHFNLKELIQEEKQLKGKKKRKMRKLKEKIALHKATKEKEDDFQVCGSLSLSHTQTHTQTREKNTH